MYVEQFDDQKSLFQVGKSKFISQREHIQLAHNIDRSNGTRRILTKLTDQHGLTTDKENESTIYNGNL